MGLAVMAKRKKDNEMQVTAVEKEAFPEPKSVVIGRSRFGHDMVQEKDPDKRIVAHEYNRRQRVVDALFDDGRISGEQYACATDLRDAWERSGLMERGGAFDTTKPKVDGGGAAPEGNGEAMYLYETCMGFLSRDERNCVRCIVLFDEPVEAYGRRLRCEGLAFLTRCLDMLAPHVARFSR